MTRLAEMFNVNHFIVSQVNPHVVPFLAKEEEIIGAEAQQGSQSAPEENINAVEDRDSAPAVFDAQFQRSDPDETTNSGAFGQHGALCPGPSSESENKYIILLLFMIN